MTHAFASEIDSVTRSVLKASHDCKHVATDITKRPLATLRALVKKNDFLTYCSGFPCVAFSMQGKRLGDADPRGQIVYDVLATVEELRPSLVIMENVKELATDPKHRKLFNEILDIAVKIGGGCYYVDWKILDSWLYGGVPATRNRVYIILVKKTSLVKKWDWPSEKTPRFLDEILDHTLPPMSLDTLSNTNLANLAAGMDKLKNMGVKNVKEQPYVIDLAGGVKFGVNVQLNKFPTITKSHANALWLVHKSRFASPPEILRAQGISIKKGDIVCPPDVNPKKLAEMAGNSFTLPVFTRLFSALLPAMGFTLD
eukprot:Skav204437  [mRNA]  locus=scaffold1093:210662:211600:+ [translate_table: standard]